LVDRHDVRDPERSGSSVGGGSVTKQSADVAMNGDRCAGSAGPATGWQWRAAYGQLRAKGIVPPKTLSTLQNS
jgi:hypothetical protein